VWPLHLWLSSSSVQRDLTSGGVGSRWLPSGGSLGSWGAVVHGEEEIVVQLLSRVRMPPSTVVPVSVVFLVGGNDGSVYRSILFMGNLRYGEATIDGGACGRCSPFGRRYGGLLDRMMTTCVVTPVGHHLWIHSSVGWVCGRLGGWASVSMCFSSGNQAGEVCYLSSTMTSLGGTV
jgi:hypothetical protein